MSPKPGVRIWTNGSLPKTPCSRTTSQRTVASLPCTWKILARPFADLRDRVDQIDELVAGLPFEAEIVVGQRVEHHLPGVGIVGDVPVAARPIAVHRTILERDAHALVGRAPRKLAPHLFVARQALLERLAANAAGESGEVFAPKRCALSISTSQPRKRLAVEIALFERIAEHAERVDRDVGVADRLAQLARELRACPCSSVCQKNGSMLSKPSLTISRT